MNKPTYIIIHCSATREDKDFTEKQINDSHVARGFGKWGYHYYIRKDGRVIPMRAENEVGAHDNFIVPGTNTSYNRCSIGICYEGGLSADCTPADTRTLMQKGSMLALLRELRLLFPKALIVGHHDLNPVKPCPCFDAVKEYRF